MYNDSFLDEININRDFPPFNNDDKIFFWWEKETQDLIKLYLKSKWEDNFEKNSKRFKINCILSNNWWWKSRLLSQFLPFDNETNNKWHDYRWHSDFTNKYCYILDDFFKLNHNFKDSINKEILNDWNYNRFYFDFLIFINSSNIREKFINSFFNTNTSLINFSLILKFNTGNLCIPYRDDEKKDYIFSNIDIELLLNNCNWDKKSILTLLYMYVKSFLDFYHFNMDGDEFFNEIDSLIEKIKWYEDYFKINESDSLIPKLPSSILNQDIDFSDMSQKICDYFCDNYMNKDYDCSEIDNDFITISFPQNQYLTIEEYSKIIDFVNLFWEVDIVFWEQNIPFEWDNDIFWGISFSDLSAWEKSILIRFTNIYRKIIDKIEKEKNKDCYDSFLSSFIILIDEPDLHLHLDWQKKYIQKLIDVFSSLPTSFNSRDLEWHSINLHFILATHSPFIISDLPVNSIIKIKTEKNLRKIMTFDWKIHNNFKDITEYEKHFINNNVNNTFWANFIDIINNGFFFENTILMWSFAEETIKTLSKKIKIISALESIDHKSDNLDLINKLLLEINEQEIKKDELENFKSKILELKNIFTKKSSLIWNKFLKDNLFYL